MQAAEYPQRSCRLAVAGEFRDYPCVIREHHPGPCAAPEAAVSVARRDQWEESNPGWEKMSAFDDPFAKAEEILRSTGG